MKIDHETNTMADTMRYSRTRVAVSVREPTNLIGLLHKATWTDTQHYYLH